MVFGADAVASVDEKKLVELGPVSREKDGV